MKYPVILCRLIAGRENFDIKMKEVKEEKNHNNQQDIHSTKTIEHNYQTIFSKFTQNFDPKNTDMFD